MLSPLILLQKRILRALFSLDYGGLGVRAGIDVGAHGLRLDLAWGALSSA